MKQVEHGGKPGTADDALGALEKSLNPQLGTPEASSLSGALGSYHYVIVAAEVARKSRKARGVPAMAFRQIRKMAAQKLILQLSERFGKVSTAEREAILELISLHIRESGLPKRLIDSLRKAGQAKR